MAASKITIAMVVDPNGAVARLKEATGDLPPETLREILERWDRLAEAGAEMVEVIYSSGRAYAALGEDFKALMREYGVVL